MNKVNLASRVPPQYYSPAFAALMRDIEQTISKGADGYLFNVKTTALSYTATVADSIILVTANSKTITLPAASLCKGKRFTVKNAAVGVTATTVQATSGNIDTAGSFLTTTAFQSADFVSDGTNYWVV